MNEFTIALVQSSFAKVLPISDVAARLFYQRLFEISPDVRPFFKGDLADQGRKLMATLAVVVNSLKHFESIQHGVQELARRHVAYGVTAEHYDKVGTALIWTLEQGLGDAFTAETRAAWIETYGVLSRLMIEAAYGAQAAKGAA